MRYYIVSWDNLGVEFFEEITEHHPENWAKDHLFDSIKQNKQYRCCQAQRHKTIDNFLIWCYNCNTQTH